MHKALVDDLQPGARLGKTLFNDRGALLLARGVALSPRFIEAIRARGFYAVHVLDGVADEVVPFDVLSDHLYADAVGAARDLFAKEMTPTAVRAAGDAPVGELDRNMWNSLDAMGVLSLLIPEADGGLGLDATFLVPILEEAGRVALPHPLVETAMVASPLVGAP